MSEKEKKELSNRLRKGLELAEYRLIRHKAQQNEVLIEGNPEGGTREVPARELLKRLYNEECPTL